MPNPSELERNAELDAIAQQVYGQGVTMPITMAEAPAKIVVEPNSFGAILYEMLALHNKKSMDYGIGEDPLANVRASERFGIPAWVGTMVRAHDKIVRIQNFVKKGVLANESVEDSLMDLAVYSVIALQLYREREAANANAMPS